MEFEPSEGVSLAYGDVPNARPYLTFKFLTAAQAKARHSCSIAHLQVPNAGTFSGEVRGIAPGDRTAVLYGGAIIQPSATADFTAVTFMLPIFSGFNDLFAVCRPKADSNRVDCLIVQRAPQLSAGNVINLDFGSSEAVTPAQFKASLLETAGAVRESYRSAFTTFVFYDGVGLLTHDLHQLLALPGALRVPDDRYEISLTSLNGLRSVTA